VTLSQCRTAVLVIGVLFIGLRVAGEVTGRRIPDWIYFSAAATALFRFGYSLQNHSILTLRRFRFSFRTGLWLSAVTAFWYSTAIWIWWSLRTKNFPLFLLNKELKTSLHFEWVLVAVILGLALEARALRIQNRK
jgi:hypothetical protein